MKVNHKKYDVEQFAYDLKALWKIIGMSDKEILEHYKGSFPQKENFNSLQLMTLM